MRVAAAADPAQCCLGLQIPHTLAFSVSFRCKETPPEVLIQRQSRRGILSTCLGQRADVAVDLRKISKRAHVCIHRRPRHSLSFPLTE